MREPRSRAERAEQTRAEVLDAARRVFLRDGFHAATVEQIAAEAGYTKGAIFSRFESKADLFLALLEQRIERRATENERLLEEIGNLPELARRWCEIQRRDLAWTMLVVEFRAHAARDPELNRRYRALHDRTIDGARQVVERCGPWDAAEARDVAQILLAFGIGVTLEQACDPDALPPEDAPLIIGRLLGIPG